MKMALRHKIDNGSPRPRLHSTCKDTQRRSSVCGCGKAILLIVALLAVAACQTMTKYELQSRTTLQDAEFTVTPDSEIVLIYLSARNCPPCIVFESKQYPDWARSEAAKSVTFYKFNFNRYQNTSGNYGWPEAFRWVREKTPVQHGAPRYIVLLDNRVISNQMGRKAGWTTTVELLAKLAY